MGTPTERIIVVVDDEIDNVESLLLILVAAGYEAYGATDGASGLRIAADRGAQLVLLDYVMSPMGGDEVGRRLRADARTREIKIVMCSGSAESTVRLNFSGYDAFLTKPISGQDLLATIAAV